MQSLFTIDPYEHQRKALDFCDGREFYALLMEQGTGKTFVLIKDAARRWVRGEIIGLLALAPSGVHTNWVLREIPKHMPPWVNYVSAAWYAGANKAEREALELLMAKRTDGALRVLAMNYEALTTDAGLQFAKEFLRRCSLGKGAMVAGDESQNIKNPKAIRTKKLDKVLRPLSKVRALMSGTAIVNSPWDAFAQFNFLSPTILQQPSYTTFKAEYAELLPPNHGLLRHITARLRPATEGRFKPKVEQEFSGEALQVLKGQLCQTEEFQHFSSVEVFELKLAEKITELKSFRLKELVDEELAKHAPQLVARDTITGLPLWRNLDKLEALIAPHAFRVLKKDCLDLPEKIYTQRFFRMTAKQSAAYDRARDDLRLQLLDDTIIPLARIAALTKLAQIESGYFVIPGTATFDEGLRFERIMTLEDNPKLIALADELNECIVDRGEQVIVWARFHHEIDDICAMLTKMNVPHVAYHGKVKRRDRSDNLNEFEAGRAKVFVGQQAAGGTGITAIAPNSMAATMSVLYYSNTFALGDRLQSEDRAHRIGQEKSVRYADFIVPGCICEKIIASLTAKIDLAQTVLGDKRRALTLIESGA